MKTFDLYGSKLLSVMQFRVLVESVVGIEFVYRTSDFHGEYFLAEDPERKGESFTIRPNLSDDEGYLPEPDFPHHTVLLYVDDTKRADEVRSILNESSELTFLRREYA